MKHTLKNIVSVLLLICSTILLLIGILMIGVPIEAGGEKVFYPNVVMAALFIIPAWVLGRFGIQMRNLSRRTQEKSLEERIAEEESRISEVKAQTAAEYSLILEKHRQELEEVELGVLEKRAAYEKEMAELSLRQEEMARLRIELDEEKVEIENMRNINWRLVEQRRKNADVTLVDGMEGHEFEYFCADLLKDLRYDEVEVTKGSGDQGVDIIAQKDGMKYAIQCKNYTSKLGNTPIQEVCTGKVFYGCDAAVVLTNSTFTPAAIKLAERVDVQIWDRAVLQAMMYEAYT